MAKEQKYERIAWHPAACSAIRLELAPWAEFLRIEDEYHLSREPLRLDVLVVKKPPDLVIDRPFARAFRGHNLIEYKGPSDALSARSFHKALAYAMLYLDKEKLDERDITLTLIGSRRPRTLLAFLKERWRLRVGRSSPGVYQVEGAPFPMQIIASAELRDEESLWLKNLRNDLLAEDLSALGRRLPEEADAGLVKSYLSPIIEATRQLTKENGMPEYMFDMLVEKGFFRKWEENFKARIRVEEKAAAKREDARSVLALGLTPEQVAQALGLPLAEVEALR